MAHMVNWNPEEKIPEIARAGMEVLEEACSIIVQDAKVNLVAALRGNNGKWKEHGPYKSGKYAGKSWTARYMGSMVKSIRLVKKHDPKSRNIWIMAGNYNTWWAVQMEYGHGAWKGGRRSFFRSAIMGAMPKIRMLLASRRIR